MVWYLLSLLGAFFDATYYALIKRFLRQVHYAILGSGVFFMAFLILFLVSLIRGIPVLGKGFFLAVLVTSVLNLVATILYYAAFKTSDLSLTMPMISFTPLFLIFTSFIILHELPTIPGIIGMVLIVIGSYFLNMARKSKNILDPFRQMYKNKGVLYMLIVAFLYSISANFDKLVVKNSDAYFGSAIVYLFLFISFTFIALVKVQGLAHAYVKNFPVFLLTASVLSLIAITINLAYTQQIVPYVISIKRTSIVFSVLYGWLLFKEKDITKRLLAALILLAGVVLIILF
ncbi:MAG: EamA family transporter [Nanoarchaeota archaeon]